MAATAERLDDARAQLELADSLTQTGCIEEALDGYRRAIKIDPDYVEVHLHLGYVLIEAGRVAEGFEHLFRRAELGKLCTGSHG
jgi:Tfp pilus assembly protein PilF